MELDPKESMNLAQLKRGEKLKFFLTLLEGRQELPHVYRILLRFLKEHGLAPIYKSLTMLFDETFSNHVKGYAKRVFFERKSALLRSEEEYTELMESFSDEVILNWNEFWKGVKQDSYKTELRLHFRREHICIYFKSNYSLLPWEKKRIKERIDGFLSFAKRSGLEIPMEPSPSPSLDEPIFPDTLEGGGLGIFMMLRILTDIGVPLKTYRTYSYSGNTSSYFCLSIKSLTERLKNKASLIVT